MHDVAYCTRHLMYFGLSKSSIQNEGMSNLFNEFVGEQMRTSIKQTNVVSVIDATRLADKWASFLQHRVYASYFFFKKFGRRH